MPFAIIPENAFDALPKLSGSAVKVMVAIAGFMPAGRDNGGGYPSLAAIGERAGINRQPTLTTVIRELAEAKVLVCERRRRKTSLYKWGILETAESVTSNILETTESDALKQVLDHTVSDPVMHTETVWGKDTKKDTHCCPV